VFLTQHIIVSNSYTSNDLMRILNTTAKEDAACGGWLYPHKFKNLFFAGVSEWALWDGGAENGEKANGLFTRKCAAII